MGNRRIYLLVLLLGGVSWCRSQDYWQHQVPVQLNDPQQSQQFILDTLRFFTALRDQKSITLPIPGITAPRTFKRRSNFSSDLALKYKAITSYVSDEALPLIYLDQYDGKVEIFLIDQHKTLFIIPDTVHPLQPVYIMIAHDPTHLVPGGSFFKCLNDDTPVTLGDFNASGVRSRPLGPISKRTYRMALAVTAEYARLHGSTKEQIMASLNVDLTRINAVFIQELGVDFKLVANNDTLIFFDPASDPYTNSNLGAMLTENTETISNRIGLANFDIGHVFGTDAGGLAQLGCVCTANKAAGASAPFGVYSGVHFYLTPCHEIGHQLGATHSFNLCDNQNETSSSGYEPGSGSTIMSYAGASNCGPNYVQGRSDAYFHSFSIQQMKQFVRAGIGSLCGTLNPLVQNEPMTTILSPTGIAIPILTPFELEGRAIDDFSDPMTFTWEELDLGVKSILGQPSGTAPLFRSYSPTTSPTRIFPTLSSVLSNQKMSTEVLPSTTRDLNFRFLARDNDPLGGGTHWSDFQIRAIHTAGPFRISNLNTKDTFYRNEPVYLAWDVANTDRMPISTKKVTIYWTDKGGQSFDLVLKRDIPNDGGEWITLPDAATTKGRIKIKATDNVYFDINDADLTVLDQLNPALTTWSEPDLLPLCEGGLGEVTIKTSTTSSNDTIQLLATSALSNFSLQFSKLRLTKNDSARLFIRLHMNRFIEDSSLHIKGINTRTKDTISFHLRINIIQLKNRYISPANNQDQVATSPLFRWEKTSPDNEYLIEVAENPTFKTIVWSRSIQPSDTTAVPDVPFKTNTVYYWRIRPKEYCFSDAIPFVVFHTQSIACKTFQPIDLPKFISATGTPRIISEIIVEDIFHISQITIPLVKGTHEFIGDLRVSLKAPSGDSIIIWNQLCNNLSNFHLGFEDDAAIPLTCPLTDRKLHKSQEPLGGLIHTTTKGSWKLQIQDLNNGSGGSLDDWALQLCGALIQNGPFIKTNDTVEVIELQSKIIDITHFEALDIDSGPNNIKFILLKDPGNGQLIKNTADVLTIGSEILQSDINSGRIVFRANRVNADTLESIPLLLMDEKNNWSGIQTLTVRVIKDITIPIHHQASRSRLLQAYPNPFYEEVSLENSSDQYLRAEVYSMTGVLVERLILPPLTLIKKRWNLTSGMYYIKFAAGTTVDYLPIMVFGK